MAGSDARWGGGASWAGLACGVGLMGCAWHGFVGLWVCAFGKGGGRRRWWLGWVVYTTISLFARENDKDCSLEKGIGQGSDRSDPERLISRAAEQP